MLWIKTKFLLGFDRCHVSLQVKQGKNAGGSRFERDSNMSDFDWSVGQGGYSSVSHSGYGLFAHIVFRLVPD